MTRDQIVDALARLGGRFPRQVRLCARGQHWLAALLMMVFALVYLWPVLLGGRVLSPNSVLFAFWPWHAVAPPNYTQTWNPLLTDVPTAYYPWAVVARRLLHAGVFPAWNPYAFAGTPFFANAQTALLSPFNAPLWLLPLNFGIALTTWFKLWLGGFGTYLLVRELKLGFWPGLLAGVSFLLCAFNVVWLTHETLPAVAAMFPWALWMVERIARHRRVGDGVGLAVVAAIAIFAGQPELAAQVLAGALLFLGIRVATSAGLDRRERARAVVVGLGGVFFGVLLAAVVLLPDLRAGLGTPGAGARRNGDFTLPWLTLKNLAFPNWSPRLELPQPEPYDYLERTAYVGVPATLLAVAALLTRDRWRQKLPLAVLALLGIAIPFGVPGIRWIADHLPVLGNTQLPRLLIWFELAIPVLAAFGLQALMEAPRRQRRAWMGLGLGALVAVVAVVTLGPSLHELRTTLNHFRTGRNYSEAQIVSLTSVGWWSIFTVLLAGAVLLMRRSRPWVGAAAIVVLAMLDLLHFASGFQPMLAPAAANPRSTPAVAYLQRHAKDARVVGIGYTLVNDYDSVYGLRDVRGYDPPQPSYDYLRLWRLANPGQGVTKPYTVFGLSPAGVHALSLLGARYIIAPPGTPPPAGLQPSPVYAGPDATIYENPDAAPRALIPSRVLVAKNQRDELNLISSGRFDPRADVIVEPSGPGLRRLLSPASGGTVSVTDDANSTVSLKAHIEGAGVVVLNDAMADGWGVTVDGVPRPALSVDDVMRGVRVPAGTHVVTWRYRVPGLRAGSALTGVALLALLCIGGLEIRARRRRRHST